MCQSNLKIMDILVHFQVEERVLICSTDWRDEIPVQALEQQPHDCRANARPSWQSEQATAQQRQAV
jgi:hypothetical protein